MIAEVLRWASIQSRRHPHVDYEPIVLFALGSAALAWDPTRGRKTFRNFAIKRIRSACRDEWLARRRDLRRVDRFARLRPASWSPPADRLVLTEDVARVRAVLDPVICDGLMDGLSNRQIGERIGIGKEGVRKRLLRVAEQLGEA